MPSKVSQSTVVSRKSKQADAANDARYSQETRGADAITVFWLLAGLSAAIAELGWFILAQTRSQFDDVERWLALRGVIVAAALLTGAVVLALTPITIRVRRVPPPQPVIAMMVLVGALPFALMAVFPGG